MNLKNKFALLIILGIILGLSACSNDKEEEEEVLSYATLNDVSLKQTINEKDAFELTDLNEELFFSSGVSFNEKTINWSKEIRVDFSVNGVESDDFLHLLSEEENSEEQYQALQRCLEKLSKEQKACIMQFFLEEMSYADVVEQTGYTLKSVKSYIQNGKRNLKICMNKQETL